MQVAICIATFRRPEGLARLLRSLTQLREPYGIDLRVVVVDNDAAGSAGAVVTALGPSVAWPVDYRIEGRRGVSHVRNAALEATAECDFIAFIDDDETADAEWLAELLAVQQQAGAAAVTGPTLPLFQGAPPPWLRSAFTHCYVRPKSGAAMAEFATSNVLLDRRVLQRLGLRFDESLALVGGEDTMLAFELVRHGRRIAWAERALTYEYVPESRIRLGWLLRRWYRTGNIEALLRMRGRSGFAGRSLGLVGGVARIGFGTADLLISLPAWLIGARGRVLRRLYTVARGLGMLAGVLGRQHQEYRTIHGA
jgi:succinoglycan biosynthesis protein ExoM